MGWQWHQLDHMQIICILRQTDNHTTTSPLFLRVGRSSWHPTNSCQNIKVNLAKYTGQTSFCSKVTIWTCKQQYILTVDQLLYVDTQWQLVNQQICCKTVTYFSFRQETQLSLRDRATRACQLKSGKVLHKCRRLAFEKLWN